MALIDQRAGNWQARVRVSGYKDKGRTFDTQAETEVWAMRTEAQLRNGVDAVPDYALEPTLGEAFTSDSGDGAIRAPRRHPAMRDLPLAVRSRRCEASNDAPARHEERRRLKISGSMTTSTALNCNLLADRFVLLCALAMRILI